MTIKEAIGNLECVREHIENPTNEIAVGCAITAITFGIEALEKQIPKKPVMEGDGYADGYPVYDTWICPNCETHYEVDCDRYDYCPKCEQKLDLSEVN